MGAEDPSLFRDILNLGVPGILLMMVFALVTGRVISQQIHDKIVGDRDKQIEALRTDNVDLRQELKHQTETTTAAVRDLVQAQKETLQEQRQTIDLLLELNRRSGGTPAHE